MFYYNFLRFMDQFYHKTGGLITPMKYFCDKWEKYLDDEANEKCPKSVLPYLTNTAFESED